MSTGVPPQASPATQTPPPTAAAPPDPAAIEAAVQAGLREISHIATLPEVTIKIIELVEDPDSTAQDLNKVISNDPALGARILKVVNSAFYGLPGQIGSINRAVVLLGLNAVKNIAIAASLAKLFRGGHICPAFDARQLWHHSITSACATKKLAEKVGLGLPDEAFLAGLIHDIGIMVEIQAMRPKFVEVMDRMDQDPALKLRDAELAVIGATHEHFCEGLCKLWKFPASFAYITGYHHRPLELPEQHVTLAGLVHVADIITRRLDLGWPRGVESDEIDLNLLAALKLTPDILDEVAAETPEAADEANGLFKLSA